MRPAWLALLIALLTLPDAGIAAPVRASALLGAEVANAEGKTIGSLSDLAIDVAAGSVEYAIVDAAPMSRKLEAVPFDALRRDRARNQLVRTAVVRLHAGGEPTVEVPFSALRFPTDSARALLTL